MGNEIGEVGRGSKISALQAKEHELYCVCRWESVKLLSCVSAGRSTRQKRADGKHVDETLGMDWQEGREGG